MDKKYILPLADSEATLTVVGGKGASLARLAAASLPVPDGFHVTTRAYKRFIEANGLQPHIINESASLDPLSPASLEAISEKIQERIISSPIPQQIVDEIAEAYEKLAGDLPTVAVRSSATAEDLPDLSFAGQQETYLNVEGVVEVLDAVRKCWASLWTARAIGYRHRNQIDASQIALAVVVQLMVPAQSSGVMFTAHPMTGKRDQVLINAAWGLGEAIVGGEVTPDTLVVEKNSYRILERKTADKQQMTIGQKNGTIKQNVPEDLRKIAVLDDQAAAALTELGVHVEQLYGTPMDIEWTRTNGKFAIVQARPITVLPEREVIEIKDWPIPNPKGRYMRTSIVDLMPDPLSPLFSTAGLIAINRGIGLMSVDMFKIPEATFLGIMKTINGYAYQELSFTAKQWFDMLYRIIPASIRMLRTGVQYWQEKINPRYVETTNRWRDMDYTKLSAGELLKGINELLSIFGHHLGALMASTMGPSAGSETLFTKVYKSVARAEDGPAASAFLMCFDSFPISSDKALYDLAMWCKDNQDIADYLLNTSSEQIVENLQRREIPENIPEKELLEWHERINNYLDQYGYSIYTIDFASPLPMDEPTPFIEMIKLYLTHQAKSPYQRQSEIAEKREKSEKEIRSRISGLKLWAFNKSLNWAQSLAPLREDGIASIGYCYPVLRRMLKELGSRFVNTGSIEAADDIFLMEQDEVVAAANAVEQGKSPQGMKGIVRERKVLWQARKRLTPPSQLPLNKKRYLGFNLDGVLAGGEGALEGNVIKGVAASPGKITAPARVLLHPEEFDQMEPGEILVAGITTPAWTPLFSMAAGVVTDIGGPLSHGSIVAREYGIPAVLGTGLATKLIQSGQLISIDGEAGTVTLLT